MSARIAVDIGGTFTDVVLDTGQERVTTKILTTQRDPSDAVFSGTTQVLRMAGLEPSAVELIVHGTTLATNALIQRRGAKTALITTEGHRDAVEMAQENRFEQYDVHIERPEPLVPRYLRFTVPERLDRDGNVLVALREAALEQILELMTREDVESVAVGLIHAYANPDHERRIREILQQKGPPLSISLSSEVCPEIREYERLSTTCANAYVQPLMARYLSRLADGFQQQGLHCPLLIMTSGGGLTTLDTGIRFPIRLLESGPAGGAILAARVAEECSIRQVISFDMGGTTAKICLIDEAQPLTSRTFEVDRVYRFKKGSGLPVRLPVIEMVEIGAGGGSIISIDDLGRVQVGPESAGSEPGPAAYDRGGERPTVTDADLTLGRIDPAYFAGGALPLDGARAETALGSFVAEPMGWSTDVAAYGACEVVDENMTAACRAHAVEWGKDVTGRTLVAFGGAAPLHACRLAEKLGIRRVIVPTGAGVGSAIGFLLAPISYEVVRSRAMKLADFDPELINDLMEEMRREAEAVVRQGAPAGALREERTGFMRYVGQGYEVTVPLPVRRLSGEDVDTILDSFVKTYRGLFGRTVPGIDIEALSWTLSLSARSDPSQTPASTEQTADATVLSPTKYRTVFDPELSRRIEFGFFERSELAPLAVVRGPALIVESQTTTVVTSSFNASVNPLGYIVLERKD